MTPHTPSKPLAEKIVEHFEMMGTAGTTDFHTANVLAVETLLSQSKPQPTEQPPTSSVFKEESPQPWEEWLWEKAVDRCLLEDDVTEIIGRIRDELLTTKRELFERVEKEVIGEDEDMMAATLGKRKQGRPSRMRLLQESKVKNGDHYIVNVKVENQLRATQRAKLTQLREEL